MLPLGDAGARLRRTGPWLRCVQSDVLENQNVLNNTSLVWLHVTHTNQSACRSMAHMRRPKPRLTLGWWLAGAVVGVVGQLGGRAAQWYAFGLWEH